MSVELFSQICFNFLQTFLGWYSTNHFRALLCPRSQNLVCGLSLMTMGSTLPAAFGLVPDTYHRGRSSAERMFTEVWCLQHIHILSLVDNGHRKGCAE